MLDRLLETGAHPRKSGWGGTVSVVVHGAIIALVVATNAKASQPPAPVWRDPFVVRLPTPADDHASGKPASGGAQGGAPRTVPSIPIVDFPPVADPPLPGTAVAAPNPGADAALLSEIRGSGGGPGMTSGSDAVATDATVDTPVRALADRPPAYPETLRAAGIGGVVRLRFIVDTTGRAEPSSIRVIESSHELFTRAVLLALRQARFTPGAVAGHPVRTLVERAYRFDIGG